MPKVYFKREFKEVEVEAGTDLRSVARDHGIELYAGMARVVNCRGRGLCGTCKVRVYQPDAVSPHTSAEELKIPATDRRVRLACQCLVQGDVEVLSFPRVRQGWMEHACYQHLIEE